MDRTEEIQKFLKNIGIADENKLSPLELKVINALDEESYNTLTSENAIAAYKTGVKFSELAAIVDDKVKFATLTHPKFAILCYQAGAKFSDINKIADNPELAAAINSLGQTFRLQGLETFKAGVSFEDLLSVVHDKDKFNALTSENAIAAYKTGVKFSELAAIVDDKVKFATLTHPKFAILCYQAGAKFSDINKIADNPELAAAINSLGQTFRLQGLETFKAGVSFEDLLSVVHDKDKFNALTSENAIAAYKTGVKFSELAAIVDDKVKFATLTHPKFAILCYQAGAKFSDINKIADNPELATAINSLGQTFRLQGLETFKAGVSFEDLLSVVHDKDKFNALTSENAITAYQAGVKFSKLNKLYIRAEAIGTEVMQQSSIENQQTKAEEISKIAQHITSLCKTTKDYKLLSTACKKPNKILGKFSRCISQKNNIAHLIMNKATVKSGATGFEIDPTLLKQHVSKESIAGKAQSARIK